MSHVITIAIFSSYQDLCYGGLFLWLDTFTEDYELVLTAVTGVVLD